MTRTSFNYIRKLDSCKIKLFNFVPLIKTKATAKLKSDVLLACVARARKGEREEWTPELRPSDRSAGR